MHDRVNKCEKPTPSSPIFSFYRDDKLDFFEPSLNQSCVRLNRECWIYHI